MSTITERDESWREIDGFEGRYAVSTLGRVRSLDRTNINVNGVRRILRGKMLRLSRDSEGYHQVGLLRNGRETKVRVHRLVARAFLPNPGNLPVVDHRNRVRTDNVRSNLRWATYSQNRRNADMRALAEAEAGRAERG